MKEKREKSISSGMRKKREEEEDERKRKEEDEDPEGDEEGGEEEGDRRSDGRAAGEEDDEGDAQSIGPFLLLLRQLRAVAHPSPNSPSLPFVGISIPMSSSLAPASSLSAHSGFIK